VLSFDNLNIEIAYMATQSILMGNSRRVRNVGNK